LRLFEEIMGYRLYLSVAEAERMKMLQCAGPLAKRFRDTICPTPSRWAWPMNGARPLPRIWHARRRGRRPIRPTFYRGRYSGVRHDCPRYRFHVRHHGLSDFEFHACSEIHQLRALGAAAFPAAVVAGGGGGGWYGPGKVGTGFSYPSGARKSGAPVFVSGAASEEIWARKKWGASFPPRRRVEKTDGVLNARAPSRPQRRAGSR
jgi:hypothetical protein